MDNWALFLIWNLSITTYIISGTVLVIFRSRLPKLMFRLLLAFVIISILSEIANKSLIYFFGLYSVYTYSIYLLVAGALVLYLYKDQLRISWLKRLSLLFLAVHIVFAGYEVFEVYSGKNIYVQYAQIFRSIAVLLLAILYFYESILRPAFQRIENQPFFWVNSGFIILYGGTLFLWLFESYVTSEVGDLAIYKYVWPIQNLATIIFNLLLIRSVWRQKQISY